jgi:photosystem II stability/assembly factor-like uncharacterized protein
MSRHKDCANFGVLLISVFVLVFSTAAIPQTKTAPRHRTTHSAQQPSTPTTSTAQGNIHYKGIFEPVSYQEDLELFDAFFITPDEGWVAGEKGTILHTTDAGKTWKAQLGGDPHGTEQALRDLRFVDSRHGWAATGNGLGLPLLRTVDGQNWQQVGTIGDMYTSYEDYVFMSPNTGVYVQKQTIRRTTDGGKTWKDVLAPCAARIQVQGITQQVGCSLKSVHFPSANVGYAVGTSNAGGTMILAKTTDGGVSWGVATTPNAFTPDRDESAFKQYIFFLDENTGFVRFSDGKTIMSTDGGKSWTPTGATVVDTMKFADPEVGWALSNGQFSFSTDGGRHWSSRRLDFPAVVRSLSFPRRNRAYVVGQHGMVFRYSIVPDTYSAADTIDAPSMPGLNSPLTAETQQMKTEVATLRTQFQTKLGIAAPAPANPAGSDASAASDGSFQQPSPAPATADTSFQQSSADASAAPQSGAGVQGGGLVDSCCGAVISQLSQTVNSFSADVPKFSGSGRSLNLIIAGMQYLSDLTGRANSLKTVLASLRQAKDPQSALAALNAMSSQVNVTANDTSAGFQQDAGFQQSTDASGTAMQSSGFESAAQPGTQTSDPNANSSSQNPNASGQSTNSQQPPPKKKSRWGLPSIPSIPVPH